MKGTDKGVFDAIVILVPQTIINADIIFRRDLDGLISTVSTCMRLDLGQKTNARCAKAGASKEGGQARVVLWSVS